MDIENEIPLTRLDENQKGEIAFIRGSQKIVKRLSDLGLIPMSEVLVMRKTMMRGPIEVYVKRTTLAIAHDIAENIFVKLKSNTKIKKN